MYVAITCCIMTYSISKGFVTYHGSMECEINYSYNYTNTDSSVQAAVLSATQTVTQFIIQLLFTSVTHCQL